MSAGIDPYAPGVKRAIVLNPQRMQLAEQWRQDWVVNAEEGTVVDDVLDTGYWSHMAAQLNRFDRIEVRLETGEWIVDLIVTETGRNWAAVHLVAKHDLQPTSDAPAESAKHKVFWRGQHHKWAVKRLSDNDVLQNGFPDSAAAKAWLDQYENRVLTS